MTKQLTLLFMMLFCAIYLHGQAPNAIPYQGVARNAAGNILSSQNIGLRLSIRNLTANGTVVYSETHNVVTTPLGLFNINIGSGTPVTGTLATVNWATGAKFLQVEMDATGGTAYVDMGTTQLNSVPYALFAGSAGGTIGGSGTLNFIPKFTPTGVSLGNSLLFDNGSSIGLGTTTPTHRFNVSHTGSTGIGVNSTSGFSVVDIDAASGDAALRFARAGVNQWNTRNRPGDDYYEIFELGGGGSRFVIQDGTGNVGIGETTSPSYRLDVLHGGSTGIRSRSSGSFSVVDIDAFSGDAALRFAKAGVNQWNIRNRPADDYLEIFELGGGGSRFVIQDGTGNVGIGETTSPSYRLDVLHGGSTGIRSRSSSSFSVVDIDAESGDAALRFARAGANQWNIRNNPGNDDLQIFELGGGGERLAIKNATGNLTVGGADGSYRLDVLHGGSTGARIRSSATFSVLDIDADNGDAALRFAKAGANQWNIRNNPGTDDLQIFELGGGGERMRIENNTGNVVVNGNLSKGGGSFKIDHPLDPENKYLYHSFVESPDMMNIYNGNITTDASGKATVTLPEYFEALNMEYRYQLTVIGSFAQAIINKEVSNNSFEIATNQPNVKVSWQVTGIRKDAFANNNRIPTVVEKAPQDKGKYLHPKAFNKPETKAIGYVESEGQASSLTDTKPTIEVSKRGANDENEGSLKQNPIVPVSSKTTEITGSLIQGEIKPISSTPGDTSGSVSEQGNRTQPKAKNVTTGTDTKDSTNN